ncbi:MAG: hypothetical protein ACKVT0_10320 [Planctomycetaceae bacterium]
MTDAEYHQMPEYSTPGEYKVKLILQVPGPLYPRRKYKEYRLLTVEGAFTLPFVPYPGLYLTFSKPHWKKKRNPVKLYLRIRTVEWQVSERYFECVADETFAREPGFELQEVRGSPHIETHFVELQKTFEYLGFAVSTDENAILWALHKTADGTEIGSREDYFDTR